MINPKEYQIIKQMIASYWSTLDLKTIKMEYVKASLLSQNMKLAKGESLQYGLELLPATLSPVGNFCPGAGDCKFSCLAFSGKGNIVKGPKIINGTELSLGLKAKARRSFLYVNDRAFFELLLKSEIDRYSMLAGFSGQNVGFRLNVTSDLDWYEFIATMPTIQFYDYTKVWDRAATKNYQLTYSASELTSDDAIIQKLKDGHNVAIVFNKIPDTYLGHVVVSGDNDDARYLDKSGIIIGLILKVTVGGKGNSAKFIR